MSNTKNNNNRFVSNVEAPWAEAPQYQNNRNTKQSKCHQTKNANKYYSKNTNYSKPQSEVQTSIHNRGLEISYQTTNEMSAQLVPVEQHSSYEPAVETLPKPEETNISNGSAFSPSTDSNDSECLNEDQELHSDTMPQNVYDQGLQTFVPQNEMMYNPEVYDYQQTSVQQQSQYYIYQPYQDYSQVPNIAGSPLNNSFTGTPQQQPQYYPAYQQIPSYIYDPQAGTYTSAYSPVQQNSHLNFQQTPGNNQQVSGSMSSPQQQQTSFLASYQTPPQPAHQLYIQTSNITPPTSLSPNDTPSTNMSSSTGTDRTNECHSPHPTQNGTAPTHLAQTPVQNPYVMYNQDIPSTVPQSQYTMAPHSNTMYTPLTPQTYQCNSPLPTAQFMMYNPPPMLQGSPYQTGPNSPMLHTPYSVNNTNSLTPNKYNNNSRYNNRSNRFNQNKRNFNQKYSYPDQTPQSSYPQDESMYTNTPNGVPLLRSFEQNLDHVDQSNLENQVSAYPTNSFCDSNNGMPNTEAILNAAYNSYDNIESYGDDYTDGYDDNINCDDNDENLACQVCRGRRMCFCYFLKVRYYKFPSFFDLVDHQYKKWRKTMASNQLLHQQQMMNSPNMSMMNQSPNMNTSMMTMNPQMNTPKKA